MSFSFLSGPTTNTLRTVMLSAGVRWVGSPDVLAGSDHRPLVVDVTVD